MNHSRFLQVFGDRVKGKCDSSSGHIMKAKEKNKLVNGVQLLERLFDSKVRPTDRWLRDQVKSGRIPSCKIGRLRFFDEDRVRAAIFE
jgi:hypothetical protein